MSSKPSEQISNYLTRVWDNVYEKQVEVSSPARKLKHLSYYSALQALEFFENLPENSVVVQGGCGHGSAVKLMADMETSSNVVPLGIDLSRVALQRARDANHLTTIEGNIANIPLASESIDRFFEVGVVEHFYRDGVSRPFVDRRLIVESFREAHRVLKCGGMAAFIQPSYRSFGRVEHRIRDCIGTWNMGFQEDFYVEDFTQLMELGGFERVDYTTIQASGDLPKVIQIADAFARASLSFIGNKLLSDNIGMFFVAVGRKK